MAEFAPDRTTIHLNHIGAGSRTTYDTGVGTFFEFAELYQLPTDVFQRSPPEVHVVMEHFALHLRRLQVKASTISQYVSHIIEHLKLLGCAAHLRGTPLAVILQCARNQDARLRPTRLSQKIPIVWALMLPILRDLDVTFAFDEPSRLLYRAVMATAYGLCCRIHEIIAAAPSTNRLGQPLVDHAIMAPHVAFAFHGDTKIYRACDPRSFPPGRRPYQYTGFHDSLKNSAGGSGTRAVAANPRADTPCLVQCLFEYVVRHPPPPSGHLFPRALYSVISAVVKRVVSAHGLDASRACPHAMRVGSVTMLSALRHSAPASVPSEELEHGMWRSAEGLRPYQRSALNSGALTSLSLYDPLFMTIEYLQWYYMSEAISVATDSVA